MAVLGEGIGRAANRLGINPLKPGTLIGVAALSEPRFLVEVDAIAVLP
jgi:enamine deaminase RidA (YjgF/YER057c/UK114 family)